MKIQAYSRSSPEKRECEDSYALNLHTSVFGVFDGVTPMHEYSDESGHNGAFIAANIFKQHFEGLVNQGDLNNELIRANRKLKQQMVSKAQYDVTQKYRLWSTCAVVVRVAEEDVYYAQVGDCMAIACDDQGNTTLLTTDSVKGIADRARLKWELERQRGINVPDLQHDHEKYAYYRTLANTPEGYSVANGMQDMDRYIATGKVSKNKLKHLLIVSDGMLHSEDNIADMLSTILTNGLAKYAEELEQIELKEGLRPDDKTAILITFHDK